MKGADHPLKWSMMRLWVDSLDCYLRRNTMNTLCMYDITMLCPLIKCIIFKDIEQSTLFILV